MIYIVARDIKEAEDMAILGLCPICNSELKSSTEQRIYVDNPYIHNERHISLECPVHGDLNDILTELDFNDLEEE